jgi:hypothetical protein
MAPEIPGMFGQVRPTNQHHRGGNNEQGKSVAGMARSYGSG